MKSLPMALAALVMGASALVAGAGELRWSVMAPATPVADTASAPLVAATRAGTRTVAVGDHGVILLSDDGRHYRQARSVPVRSMLTSVQFVDAQRGFAAGHDGVVLSTVDGGETWSLLRSNPGVEQPILSLHFDGADHGLAVGLFGWALETRDGGRNWTERQIGGEDGDRHLFHIFTSPKGTWLIAAERGTVLRSTDRGHSWHSIETGNLGSFWQGLAVADGTLLVSGMRGHLYRSADDGLTWRAVESGTTQSLTSMAQLPDGRVVVSGMAGALLTSANNGASFTLAQREHGEPLTAVIAGAEQPLLFSLIGPLSAAESEPSP